MIEKIEDYKPPCTSQDHNPPMHMYLKAGKYKNTCPACGKVTEFTIPYIGSFSGWNADNNTPRFSKT